MGTLDLETSVDRSNGSALFRRRLRWALCGVVCITVFALAAVAAGRSETQRNSNARPEPSALEDAGDDRVYDDFLQQFGALRANAARRRHLAAEIVSAATKQQLDPDLLFALIATESSFDHRALSIKGARGLGQLMFPTARAVAPAVVREPDDLYSVRRNLYVTARHLRQLLVECGGDLGKALTRYYSGSHCGRAPRRDDQRYVAVISTYFASLKVKRGYHELVALRDGTVATTER